MTSSTTPKRKSNFLNTLSRLASPHTNKTRRATGPSAATSPLVSPSQERDDPFKTAVPTQPAAINSTALAAYFTTISNTSALRHSRVWKRFVRVRTDDLESVRVERAIKRVRSDLAAHTGMPAKKTSEPDVTVKEEVVLNEDDQEKPSTVNEDEHLPPPVPQETPKTPVSPSHSQRLHRSQSADPDSSARLSRAFVSSTSMRDGASSQTEGDESSTSFSKKVKKKRSMSVDPKRKGKKVVIDDFELIKVLGKGCAGKVLLVKHRTSTDICALKAITKRHVLAHQELQHTLTEQAVLKRMAAGGTDPFVVKLWYSFHDKENLFLVMV